jgi:SMC interacting uncharacterized protein involved in chromosome segregation
MGTLQSKIKKIEDQINNLNSEISKEKAIQNNSETLFQKRSTFDTKISQLKLDILEKNKNINDLRAKRLKD